MLQQIRNVLTEAVLAGAREVLLARLAGPLEARYKDATELVTDADLRSDAAMLEVFRARRALLDPSMYFRLEESGPIGTPGPKRIGADALDGTTHFSAGGNLYAVQAHYMESGVPIVGVVFQPEVYVPTEEAPRCSGRIVSAIRGQGAFARRSEFDGDTFHLGTPREVARRPGPGVRTLVGCVPVTAKMGPGDRDRAWRVHESGLAGAMVGTGNAGGNVMMIVFGGLDLYANFSAGEELDLAPAQVIAEEIGLTVWGPGRQPPVWHTPRQPFIVAPDPITADRVLTAAGL